jgi:hypothetical protein
MDTEQQKAHNIETIQLFLTAYSRDHVKAAVSEWAKAHVSERIQNKEMVYLQQGWTIHDGTYWDIPKEHDWQMHGKKIWIRPSRLPATPNEVPCPNADGSMPPPPQAVMYKPVKQDLSPVPSDLKCPICGEQTVKEPICKGCIEGRAGFTARFICMDNMDHVFYQKQEEVDGQG